MIFNTSYSPKYYLPLKKHLKLPRQGQEVNMAAIALNCILKYTMKNIQQKTLREALKYN